MSPEPAAAFAPDEALPGPTTRGAPCPGGGPALAGQPLTPAGTDSVPTYARSSAASSASTSWISTATDYSTTIPVAPRMRTLRSGAVKRGPSSACTSTAQPPPSLGSVNL